MKPVNPFFAPHLHLNYSEANPGIFWEAQAISKEDIQERIEVYMSTSEPSTRQEYRDRLESFNRGKEVFDKAADNKMESCRGTIIKGWRVVIIDPYHSDLIRLSYFDPSIIGFEELNAVDFVKRIVKESPMLLPTFLGLCLEIDAEIEKVFRKGTPST